METEASSLYVSTVAGNRHGLRDQK